MDGIKIPNLKVSWPQLDRHSESDSQVRILSEIYFENADITDAFEKSGKIKEAEQFAKKYSPEEEHDPHGYREEALIDFISDFERDLKKELESDLDKKLKALDSLPGYVGCDVSVNLFGNDSKNMHGSFDIRISVDIEMAEINSALESVFESLR